MSVFSYVLGLLYIYLKNISIYLVLYKLFNDDTSMINIFDLFCFVLVYFEKKLKIKKRHLLRHKKNPQQKAPLCVRCGLAPVRA